MVLVPQQTYCCFLVPFTNSKKWVYGVTLEPVYHGQKLGAVMLEDKVTKSFKTSNIKKAADRMKDTSLVRGKACLSIFTRV